MDNVLYMYYFFAEDVFTKEVMQIDNIGYGFISEYIISNKLTPFIKIIINFGGAIVLCVITVLSVIFIKNRKMGFSVLVNLCSVSFLNIILKMIIQRPRPEGYRLVYESGYSFPSGHSMASMAFYGYIIYLIYINVKNKYLKWGFIFLLSMLIIMIGFSRVYLGVHYVSGVLAGFIISFAYLIIYIKIIKKVDLLKL